MKILLAVDGSSYSADAAGAVASHSWPPDTIVKVLMAVEAIIPTWPDGWFSFGGSETLELVRQEMTKQAKQVVTDVAQTMPADGPAVETAVIFGDPRSVIIDYAEEWSADLVVIGSRGLTGLKRLVLGSVAQSVVSHAPCSVAVVRKKRLPDELS
ncbi:MAG TPA: universal stress protein [Pyrinomonadaceae bacterium]|nr:universal stress protein [Pyrinomonadaceae bacterium]